MKVAGLRNSSEKVGGIVFFGRMLDKIRLNAAGKLPPDYHVGTAEWTWFESRCTRFLGIDHAALTEQVLKGGDDQQILDWCFRHGRRPSDEEIEIWNDFMEKRGWRDNSSHGLLETKRKQGFAERADIQTWFDFHRADEQ